METNHPFTDAQIETLNARMRAAGFGVVSAEWVSVLKREGRESSRSDSILAEISDVYGINSFI